MPEHKGRRLGRKPCPRPGFLPTVLAENAKNSSYSYPQILARNLQKEDSAGTTKFIWDGQNVLFETDDDGSTVAAYTLAPANFGTLLAQRRSGATKFFHFDALGSTDRLTNAAQAVSDSYLYEAFGKIIASSGSTANPFKYVGRFGYYFDPDLEPLPGKHECIMRDHQYRRHGTVTLMAAINLLTGHVHGHIVERHRSRKFIEFLRMVDAAYPPEKSIRVILDNYSAHISKETRAYLATRPKRLEFIFTPTHGSWLNPIQSFFGKMARALLRDIQVASKAELKECIRKYLDQVNADPAVFRWKCRMEELSVA